MKGLDSNITRLLEQASAGDRQALEDLFPLVYDHLRLLAANRMAKESPGNTLQPTALVHEAFLKIVSGDGKASWNDRQHFFSAAALAMRRILVDRARSRRGPRRGGNRVRVSLAEAESQQANDYREDDVDWIALDLALESLERQDASLAQVVHLRYFAGLSIDDVAQLLGSSPSKVDRDWKIARAWLLREIKKNDVVSGGGNL